MMAAAQPFVSGAISKCVVGETLLTTQDGLIRIESLHRGEADDAFRAHAMDVASLNGSQTTDAFYFGGQREVREVRLRSGHRVVGTPNHRVLTCGDAGLVWRHLSDIQPGEYVATQYGDDMWSSQPAQLHDFQQSPPHGSQKGIRIPPEMTSDLGFFLGAYASEGHTSRSTYSVVITNSVESVLERVLDAARSAFGLEGRIVRQSQKCPNVTFSSKTLVEFLEYLGCGSRASQKRIPDAVLGSTREHVLAFLSGLFLDAYVTTEKACKWAICLDSAALLDDLQAVLTNLGIVHGRIEKYNRQYDKSYGEVYAAGRQAQKLLALVAFPEPLKLARAWTVLSGTFAQSTADVIPGIDGRELYEMIPRGKSGRAGAGTRVRSNYTRLLDSRTQHVSWETVRRLGEEIELPPWLDEIVNRNLHFSPVESVADAGMRPVYDISVPVTHAFVGNGIVNHNTINLPQTATIADVKEAYRYSWERMIKAVALYRDGSKLSQPLAASYDIGGDETEEQPAGGAAGFRDADANCREDRLPLHRQASPDAAAPQRLHAKGGHLGPQSLPAHRRIRRRPARRDLHRHAQGRRRFPLVDEQLRDRDFAGLAARRSARGVRRSVHVHALRAQRAGHRTRPHQDGDVDSRLHLPRARRELSRHATISRTCSRPCRWMRWVPRRSEEFIAEEEGGVGVRPAGVVGEAPSGQHAPPSGPRTAPAAAVGARRIATTAPETAASSVGTT